MNAIEDNPFSQGWREVGKILPKPRAILCISAHWETWGALVTAMEKPRTIHDFGGFPRALFEAQYPAPGSPWLAQEVKNALQTTDVGLDRDWGLDHGCWSVPHWVMPAH
jgi:4,5-DOPA dioxygenase extradiol